MERAVECSDKMRMESRPLQLATWRSAVTSARGRSSLFGAVSRENGRRGMQRASVDGFFEELPCKIVTLKLRGQSMEWIGE